MGTFYTEIRVAQLLNREVEVVGSKASVDSGSEYTWVDGRLLESICIGREKKDLQLMMANGQTVTRSLGFAHVKCGEFFTVDEVIFAEPGDMPLLGARSLEGFNARVDSQSKRLVAAGPVIAAGNIQSWKTER